MTPELNWLSDPTVFAVNRLDAHSDHVCYRTVQEAAQRHSSLRQPLDGMWRFVWSSCPAQRPAATALELVLCGSWVQAGAALAAAAPFLRLADLWLLLGLVWGSA